MQSRRRILALSAAAAAWLLVGAATHSAEAEKPKIELAVIVAANSSVEELSFYELKLMYKGDRVLQGGRPAIPLNRASTSSERVGFDQTVLGMSPKEVAQYWIDRKIRGKSGAPKAVEPAELVTRVVSRLDGSVGYVLPSQVDNTVKVVAIDGKKPGASGYIVRF